MGFYYSLTPGKANTMYDRLTSRCDYILQASPVSGQLFWIDLLRQPDNTWVYGDGGPDIPELWLPPQPDGDGLCAHLWIGYKFNDAVCDSPGRMYICQGHTLVKY